MNKVNSSVLLVGRQQYGKSFLAAKMAEKKMKMGGFAFVYNIGRQVDWPTYTSIVPVTPEIQFPSDLKKQRAAKNSFFCVEFWLVEGTKTVIKSCDISKKFKGKGVCCRMMPDCEKQVFECIFRYFHSGILIMDDFKAVTRYGMKDYLFQLYSRQNHCGARSVLGNCGCDIVTIYHNINHPPPQMWDYFTHAIIFSLLVVPDKITGEDELDEPLKILANEIRQLPKYSYGIIDLKNEYKTKINKYGI